VLYLAEVKKQTKGFIKGFKTELKLLAFQQNDQTWSSISGDELLTTEEIDKPVSEGVLIMLNLNQSRHIQEKPELAGPELVRQLQKLSRLSDKIKDQQQEVQNWKQSLTIQFQELSRRKMEMESRQEQMEAMTQEISQLEQYRQEVETIRKQISQEKQQINQFTAQFGDLMNLPADNLARFQQWISSQSHDQSRQEPDELIVAALTAFSQQQSLMNGYWQNLAEQRTELEQRQQQLQQKEFGFKNQQEDLAIVQKSLKKAQIDHEVLINTLAIKQEGLRRLNLSLEATTLKGLALGRRDSASDHQQTIAALENLPLGQLETNVNQLKAELDKLIRFVNDQEEELTLQSQAVQELEAKLAIANEYDRFSIESELAEEEERKGMLDETLLGQRRNLKERQEIFTQYLRVLRRRQGILDHDEHLASINWEAIFSQIQEIRFNLEEEQHILEAEIKQLQLNIQQNQSLIEQSEAEYQQKHQTLEQEENNLILLKNETHHLQSRVEILGEILQPVQNQADAILPQLEELQRLFSI
jgi:chromosome segregation ATPase